MPPYDHRVGFICIGGTPSLGVWANQAALGVPPHTHKTNLVAIGGHVLAHITPGGRLIPKPHRGRAGGRLFISLCAESALIPKTFETEWYYIELFWAWWRVSSLLPTTTTKTGCSHNPFFFIEIKA